MSAIKYNIGDKVRIKNLDWYNKNKNKHGDILVEYKLFSHGVYTHEHAFTKNMSKYCGQTLTISEYSNMGYKMQECIDSGEDFDIWTDEMIEGLVEEKNKPKFKVGDEIIEDVLQQKWKVIDVERTGYKLSSVNNPDLICGMDFKNEQYHKLVEKEMSLDEAGLETDFEYDGLTYTLPDGYIFKDENGNIINATKIVLEKKKKEYPKTYEDCCKVMGVNHTNDLDICEHCDYKTEITYYEDSLLEKTETLYRLIICRDAYWKIAGDEMGLGKPWKPDYDSGVNKYGIICMNGVVQKSNPTTNWERHLNKVLDFPTEEMRDDFKNNFDPDIERCKKFL